MAAQQIVSTGDVESLDYRTKSSLVKRIHRICSLYPSAQVECNVEEGEWTITVRFGPLTLDSFCGDMAELDMWIGDQEKEQQQ